MKKILIVNGSKRRKGNSYALEARIAEQLQGKAEVTTFNIGEKDVRVCLMACGFEEVSSGEKFILNINHLRSKRGTGSEQPKSKVAVLLLMIALHPLRLS